MKWQTLLFFSPPPWFPISCYRTHIPSLLLFTPILFIFSPTNFPHTSCFLVSHTCFNFFLYLCYYLVIFFPTCYYPGRLRFSSIRARCGHSRTHILISRSPNRVSSSCLSLLRPFLCTLMIQRVQECHMLPTSLPHPLHTNSEVSVGF